MDNQTQTTPPPPRNEARPEAPEVISTTDARAGSTGNKVRYVLLISVAIAVAAMVAVYVAAPDTPPGSPNSTESREQG